MSSMYKIDSVGSFLDTPPTHPPLFLQANQLSAPFHIVSNRLQIPSQVEGDNDLSDNKLTNECMDAVEKAPYLYKSFDDICIEELIGLADFDIESD